MRPGARGWPAADEIVAEFWRHSGRPSQRQLDLLINNMNIPIMALAGSADGDFPIGMFRVERNRTTFSFIDDETVKPVIGFVAWGIDGEAQDLVGWSPKDGWAGTWLGRVGLLNEFELGQPRIGDHLKVFLNIADWLRAHRKGVVVIDKDKGARLLEGLTVQASDLEEGVKLRKILERPRAKVVVPARALERAAA